ncbi:MAG: carbon-nitrogen hydrolase family protein [Acidobacteriota bacterium]|nr:carbon-nitrogen hydrolase family protein [Acidobacteriota bacterium]
MDSLNIALLQMRVGPDKEANLERAETMARRAVARGADLLVLPEMFNCPYRYDFFAPFAEPIPTGATCRRLSALAAELGRLVVGGSIPEREGETLYNTATVWSSSGECLGRHRKAHLFDVDIPGGITFTESRVFSPGTGPTVIATDRATLGLGICFDLRFADLFREEVDQGAEVLVLPGAFNTTTGPAHWEPLLRARAIENTVFVAACSPAPAADASYPAWGHSMIVDPWGEVLAAAGREEAIVSARLEASRLAAVRRALPVLGRRSPGRRNR